MTAGVLLWIASLGIYGKTAADFCAQLPAARYFSLQAAGSVPGRITCAGDGVLYSFVVEVK